MSDKKTLLLYQEYEEHFKLLTDEQKGQLIMALFAYNRGEKVELDGILQMAFSFMKADIDRNNAKYNEIVEARREAGRKGGRPRKQDAEKQTKAKKANGFFEKQTKANESKKSNKDKDKDKDNIKPLKPSIVLTNDDDASETLSQKKSKSKSKFEYEKYPDFVAFWDAYPKGHGSKLNALKAWMKHNPSQELTDVIMRVLETHKKSNRWQKQDGEFIPHASTWINSKRWEEELEPARQQRTQAPSNRFINSTGVRDFSDLVEW